MTAVGMTFDFEGPAVRTMHASGARPNVPAQARAEGDGGTNDGR